MVRSSGGGTTLSGVLARLALGVVSALALAFAILLLGSTQADADDHSQPSESGGPERSSVDADRLVGRVVTTVRSTVERPVRSVREHRAERGSGSSAKQRTGGRDEAAPRAESRRDEAPRARAKTPRAGRPGRAEQPRDDGPRTAPEPRRSRAVAEGPRAGTAAPRAEKAATPAPRSEPVVRDVVRRTAGTTAAVVDGTARGATATLDETVDGVDRVVDRVVLQVPVVRDVLPSTVLGSTTAPVTATVDDVVATTATVLGRTAERAVDDVPDVVPGPADVPGVADRGAPATTVDAVARPAVADGADRAAPPAAPGLQPVGGLHDRDARAAAVPVDGADAPDGSTGAGVRAPADRGEDDPAAAGASVAAAAGPAAGSGTSGGSGGGTGGASAGAGVAHLSQLLVGLPGLTGSPVGTADWILPGSATADLGSSPD